MKALALTIVLITLSSCRPPQDTIFIVEREVPTKPSFIVWPANDYLYQVEFANTVERYMISSRVTVLTRPAKKEIEATKQATQVDVQPTQPASAQATLTERYLAFEDTNADYIVYTYADSRQVKIASRESKEIVTSFVLQKTPRQSEQDIVKEILQTFRPKPR